MYKLKFNRTSCSGKKIWKSLMKMWVSRQCYLKSRFSLIRGFLTLKPTSEQTLHEMTNLGSWYFLSLSCDRCCAETVSKVVTSLLQVCSPLCCALPFEKKEPFHCISSAESISCLEQLCNLVAPQSYSPFILKSWNRVVLINIGYFLATERWNKNLKS